MNERTRIYGCQALRILLLAGVFAVLSPWSLNGGQGHAQEFEATSAAPVIGEPSPAEPPPLQWDRFRETFELVSGAHTEMQSASPSGVTEEFKEPEITESDIPEAKPLFHVPEARPRLNEIDRYLWSVYQRSATKRDSSGDFTWKDAAAAARLGLLTEEYAIGGMDQDFKELLFDLGHAMDADGISWTILSAFRDDYRQRLAAGFKAHGGNSFHGGSVATGGYGHGCAADLSATDDSASEVVWKWLDQHGARFGVHRPMRQSDPAHIQPFGAWHEVAAELREKRAEVRNAYLLSSTTNSDVAEPISPVVESHSGVSEAQFECARSHSAEHVRTARLERDRTARPDHFRTARFEHLRMAGLEHSRTAEPEYEKPAEPGHPISEPEHSKTTEPEYSRSAELEHSRWGGPGHSRMVWLSSHLRPRMAHVLTLDTDRPHRNARWRTIVDIRGLQRGPGESRHHTRSRARLHFAGQNGPTILRSAGAAQAATGRS
jgi:hypothetical protein